MPIVGTAAPVVPGQSTDPKLTIPHMAPQVRPRVIVKYLDEVTLPVQPIQPQGHLDVPGWDDWVAAFPGLTNEKLFAQSTTALETLSGAAQQADPSYTPVKLQNYVAFAVPEHVPPQSVALLVATHPSVERAYVEPPPVEPPNVMALDDPRSVDQGYLKPADEGGVDAMFAWGFPGGEGSGQALVDVEWGWTLDHEDLVAHAADVFSGQNALWFGHGCSVLGEIAAVDNSVGCIGIANQVASIRCSSPWRGMNAAGVYVYSVAPAILDAVEVMSFGQVLLLELQANIFGLTNVPVELEPAVFEVVRLATALGIAVVEAAGNGDNDFDLLQDDAGRFVLNPSSTDFKDSGAILVAAATSALPHTPFTKMSRGTRIDCYGWGENIETLDSDYSGTVKNLYTSTFGGTSGASAIVAGVALVVQGLAVANPSLGLPFAAWPLRDILSDAANGTESASEEDRIGVMPDLKKIIVNDALGLAPDVYLRDHVGDDGDPHEGAISASPDVFVIPRTAVADPQGSFGEGSGTEDDYLGSTVEAGTDNFVYVRARNRGGTDAVSVGATVYWAPPASLLDPALLQLVGGTTIPNVPAGEALMVSPPIRWPAAAVPPTGHYCFVALAGNEHDPAPALARFQDWDQFKRFIRVNNNVTWRNFNVVDMEPAMLKQKFLTLPFLIVGAWDRARDMTIQIGGRLPRSATLRLELPPGYLQALRLKRPTSQQVPAGLDFVTVPLSTQIEFREVPLPKGIRIPMRILVHIPEIQRHRPYEIFARQIHQGDEVGRVTWRLRP